MDRRVASPSSDEHWAPDHIVLERKVLAYSGRLLCERDAEGRVVERSPLADMAAVEQRYPAWALGPFGRIEAERALPEAPGVYALVEQGAVRYVGRSTELARTFGMRGLGHISRRDAQNAKREEWCRLNRLIVTSARFGRVIDLYVMVCGARRRLRGLPRPREDEALAEAARRVSGVARGAWHLPT